MNITNKKSRKYRKKEKIHFSEEMEKDTISLWESTDPDDDDITYRIEIKNAIENHINEYYSGIYRTFKFIIFKNNIMSILNKFDVEYKSAEVSDSDEKRIGPLKCLN